MSSRLAGKGACACSSEQVSNIRLRPSPREDIGATKKPLPRRRAAAVGITSVQTNRYRSSNSIHQPTAPAIAGFPLSWCTALLLFTAGCSDNVSNPSITESSSESAADTVEPSAQAVQDAEKAIRAEPKVKDLLYQPGQAVEWQVGVLDDGTNRVGYAHYICELLGEHDALKPTTHVRIVDIVKVTQGENLRAASLGHVACSDRQVHTP